MFKNTKLMISKVRDHSIALKMYPLFKFLVHVDSKISLGPISWDVFPDVSITILICTS